MMSESIRKTASKWGRLASIMAITGCWLLGQKILHPSAAMAAEAVAPAGQTVADCTPEKVIPNASPVILANVLYTAFPAGMAPHTGGKPPGGRMAAVRIYDPETPDHTLSGDQILWEVGHSLADADPRDRRILFAEAGALKPFTAETVTVGMLALDADITGTGALRCDFTGDGSVDGDDVAWLVQWVRRPMRTGAGQWQDWPLGAVDQSVPAVMVPPRIPAGRSGPGKEGPQQQRYRRFGALHRDRRTVLFVGSADGLLHAVDAGSFRWGDNPATTGITEQRGYFRWEQNTGDWPDYCFDYDSLCPNYGSGRELWAFIPANLLPHLKYHLLPGGDPANMNASPAVADAYLDTDEDQMADTWRTVLISAQGSGGNGMFCLDVTDPLQPALMWETTADELVRRQAAPAVVRIGRILDTATGRPRWVAFVVAGATDANRRFPVVLIVDVSTGRLVERIVLDAAADQNGDGLLQADEQLYGRDGVAGSRPATVDSDGNGLIDRIYVTSDKGLVYKILLPDEAGRKDSGINQCVLNTDFKTEDGRLVPVDRRYQPVNVSPTVLADGEGAPEEYRTDRVWVFFGTGGGAGSDEDPSSTGQTHYFFAYTDDAGKMDCHPNRHQLQWFIELAPGEHMLASAFASAGQVYFGATATAWTDPCRSISNPVDDQGSLITVDLEGTELFERSIPDVHCPPLVEDLHLYVTLPGGPLSFGLGIYNNPIQTTRRPQVRIKAWQEVSP